MPRSSRAPRYTAGFTTSPDDKAAEQILLLGMHGAIANVLRFIRENQAPISTYWNEVLSALLALAKRDAANELAAQASGLYEAAAEERSNEDDEDAQDAAEMLDEEAEAVADIASELRHGTYDEACKLFDALDSDLSERVQCFSPLAYSILRREVR
jgi:hypothetical protein